MAETALALPTSLMTPLQQDRRAVIRVQCQRPAVYSTLAGYERYWAGVYDISVKGIGLVLSSPLEVGVTLVVEMKSASRQMSFALLARVAHSTRHVDGNWIVGCELLTQITEDDLRALDR